jgi:hypothetical protein
MELQVQQKSGGVMLQSGLLGDFPVYMVKPIQRNHYRYDEQN